MRSDNGGEFISGRFTAYLRAAGIRRQLTAPYTPSQNGVVERANRTIVEAVRTTLQASGLPHSFWAEAAAHAVFVRNRLPTKAVLRVTPYQAWYGASRMPTSCVRSAASHTRISLPYIAHKLDAKSRRCVFVGFATESAQYRLYDPVTNEVFQSRDVKFDEHRLYGTAVAGGVHDTSDSDDYPADADDELVNRQVDPAPPAASRAGTACHAILPAQAPVANPVAPNAPAPARANRQGRSAGDAPAIVVPAGQLRRHMVSSGLDCTCWKLRTARRSLRSTNRTSGTERRRSSRSSRQP